MPATAADRGLPASCLGHICRILHWALPPLLLKTWPVSPASPQLPGAVSTAVGLVSLAFYCMCTCLPTPHSCCSSSTYFMVFNCVFASPKMEFVGFFLILLDDFQEARGNAELMSTSSNPESNYGFGI